MALFGKRKGKIASAITWPENVTISSATDVGTNRPYLATANTTSEASAANTGGAVTLSFSLPTGSAAASSYTVTTTPSTYTATVSSSPYTFQGLASNTAYTFTIKANNSAGSSSGTTSGSVTATTVPDAPAAPSVTSTIANRDDISWSAPAANGGKAITGYTLKSSDTGVVPSPLNVGNVTSYAITTEVGGTQQYYNVYATNANGNSAYSANSNTITTFFSPPSFFGPPAFFSPPAFFGPPAFFSPPNFFSPPRFFSPPNFFSPPRFFAPPGFFSPPRFFSPPAFFGPPMFACIDENTLMLVSSDGEIVEKPAKDIVVGDTLWSLTWDEFIDESKIDPYTWSSDSLTNIKMVETQITGVIPSIKDITITINGDASKRFSLEQTVLIKKNGVYFFGTTGVLDIGDIMLQRNSDGTYSEIEIVSTELIDEERTVYQFQASPYDILIAGDLAVHNAKGFA